MLAARDRRGRQRPAGGGAKPMSPGDAWTQSPPAALCWLQTTGAAPFEYVVREAPGLFRDSLIRLWVPHSSFHSAWQAAMLQRTAGCRLG